MVYSSTILFTHRDRDRDNRKLITCLPDSQLDYNRISVEENNYDVSKVTPGTGHLQREVSKK